MKKLLVLSVVVAMAGLANAELLIGFNTAGLPGNGPDVTNVYAAANIQNSYLTRGIGLSASGATNAFAASGWTVGLDADNAFSAGDYFQFTITAASGYQFSITNIEWRFSRSSTGPTDIALRSSLDGYTADLAVWTQPGTAAINFSNSLSLAASPSVTLVLIGYQASAAAGTARVTDGGNFGQPGIDLAVYGQVSPIPEPATIAMLGIGTLILIAQRKLRM